MLPTRFKRTGTFAAAQAAAMPSQSLAEAAS